MRIAFATYAFPPEGSNGGLATFYYELSRALTALGHEVLVITLSEQADTTENIDGVRVVRVKFDESYALNLSKLGIAPALSWFLPRVLRLHQAAQPLLEEFQPDVIECAEHGFLWALDLAARKSPLVVRCLCPAVHAMKVNEDAKTTNVDSHLVAALEAYLIRNADALTTPSTSLAGIVGELAGVDVAEFRIIKNPLAISDLATQTSSAIPAQPTTEFHPQTSNQFHPPPSTPLYPQLSSQIHPQTSFRPQANKYPHIVYVGRIEHLKGCDLIVEALPSVLEKFPDAQVTMIGLESHSIDEEERFGDKLRRRLQQLGCLENVKFTGAIPRHHIQHHLEQADFCVFPSRYDSSPFACLESMAVGMPVIASKVGGIPEYVEHDKTGLLFESENPVALADVIIRMASDESLRNRLGSAALESIRRDLHPAKIAAESLELYTEAIQRFSQEAPLRRRRTGPDPVLQSIIKAYEDFATNDYVGRRSQSMLDDAYRSGLEDGIEHTRVKMGARHRLKHFFTARNLRSVLRRDSVGELLGSLTRRL